MILAIYDASKKLFKHENCSVYIRQGSSLIVIIVLANYAASKKLFKHENCSVYIRQCSSLIVIGKT